MNIKIGFSRSKKKFPIGSWTIRLYQNTPFSHVYIRVVTSKFPSDIIVHASEGKVQRMSETQFDKRHAIVKEFEIELSKEQYIPVRNLMHEISGDDYGIMQNLGIVLVDIARIVGIRMRNPWQKGWNCSEFVFQTLRAIFPDEYEHIDPNTVTPKEIFEILTTKYRK